MKNENAFVQLSDDSDSDIESGQQNSTVKSGIDFYDANCNDDIMDSDDGGERQLALKKLRRASCHNESQRVLLTDSMQVHYIADASKVSNSERDEWTCALCTLLNSVHMKRCQVCDAERPLASNDIEQPCNVKSSSSAAARSVWVCSACTLENDEDADVCELCDSARHAKNGRDKMDKDDGACDLNDNEDDDAIQLHDHDCDDDDEEAYEDDEDVDDYDCDGSDDNEIIEIDSVPRRKSRSSLSRVVNLVDDHDDISEVSADDDDFIAHSHHQYTSETRVPPLAYPEPELSAHLRSV